MNKTVIILHGWGLNGSYYAKLVNLIEENRYKVYSLDLPGFGKEPLIKESMTLDDYVEFIHNFIESKKISNPIFIGHSFGGRVAIKYTWKYQSQVSKLILTGVPVIRHMTIKKKIGFIVAVLGGIIFKRLPNNIGNFLRKILYFFLGEWDYYKAGPLKQVFKNIIDEDLHQYLKTIKTPTLLVWGMDDELTPSSDVEKIKKINHSIKSIILPNIGHKLPYESPNVFFESIKSFL